MLNRVNRKTRSVYSCGESETEPLILHWRTTPYSHFSDCLLPRMGKGANYTEFEKSVLIELVEAAIEIVENKRNDCRMIDEKETVWFDITQKFNSNHDVRERTTAQLRALWKNLKARMKRNVICDDQQDVTEAMCWSYPATLSDVPYRKVHEITPLGHQMSNSRSVDGEQTTAFMHETDEPGEAGSDSDDTDDKVSSTHSHWLHVTVQGQDVGL